MQVATQLHCYSLESLSNNNRTSSSAYASPLFSSLPIFLSCFYHLSPLRSLNKKIPGLHHAR